MVTWETRRLGDGILKIGHGRSQRNIETSCGRYPILATGGEIGRTDDFLYDKPSVLIGRKGTIDRPQYMDTPFWSIDTLFYTIVSDSYYAKFIYYIFCTIDWKNLNEASGVPSLSSKIIENIEISIPNKAEQHRIAEALSDTDALLAAMEKLIAKKRAIKQGVMQELLTGKRRLPGFEGEWIEKTVGDCLVEIIGGGTPSRSNSIFWNGRIPWVTVKDFATFNPFTTQESISDIGLLHSATHLISKGTPITATRMGLGQIVVYAVDVAINQDMKALVLNAQTNVEYFVFWFRSKNKDIEAMGTGSTVKGITLEQLRGFPIGLPPTVAEQAAIAEILSDMDAEIDALTVKLHKLRHIKQGMMSELLTGRIRLIDQEQVS